MEVIAITNPEAGAFVSSTKEIKEVSLKYCVNLLKNREPKEDFKRIIQRKVTLHKERMEEHFENDLDEISMSQFSNALKKVSNTHSEKYKFILKGGKSLMNAIYTLFSMVWKREQIPKSWSNSELIQLYKGKGSESDLNNIRHIHLKEEIPKLFEKIVMLAAKDDLMKNMTEFQITTKPGHRATEHVFCVMSQMALSELNGEAIFITLFDMSKYIDRECLLDCMSEVYNCSVKGKLYKLLFRLNENIRIRVRTPVGLTEAQDTGPNVGQGTISGAVVSSVNLDQGMKEYFHDEEDNGKGDGKDKEVDEKVL